MTQGCESERLGAEHLEHATVAMSTLLRHLVLRWNPDALVGLYQPKATLTLTLFSFSVYTFTLRYEFPLTG